VTPTVTIRVYNVQDCNTLCDTNWSLHTS